MAHELRIFSSAFHTSYQYNLATAFPEHEWSFLGPWSSNRPITDNVVIDRSDNIDQYDLYLAHSPREFISLAGRLDRLGISRARLVYITHWGYQPKQWIHVYDDVPLEVFTRDASLSPIVCVSHYMPKQFGFYSDVAIEVIPHFIPQELFDDVVWKDGGTSYVNIVNSFYAPERGVGADFWDSLPISKCLYGGGNRPSDGGNLNSVSEFKSAITRARAYLWTADAAATSFAPLEAMALGCPMIAPDNADWRTDFDHGREILLYKAGDKESCLEQIHAFESSSDLRRSLSECGRAAVLQRFKKELFRGRWQRIISAAMTVPKFDKHQIDYCVRRGAGVMRRDDGLFDLATEITLDNAAIKVVHPQSDETDIRRELRNKSNSIDLLEGFSAAAARLNSDDLSISMSKDYGAVTQLLVSQGCAVEVLTEPEFMRFEKRTHHFNEALYKGHYHPSLRFSENDDRKLVSKWADVDIGSLIERNNSRTVVFLNFDGREPGLINDMLEAGFRPRLFIANCMPDSSWAKGCHVEVIVEKLDQNGYHIEFLSIPGLEDIRGEIAEGDTIPKRHRYVLRASRQEH